MADERRRIGEVERFLGKLLLLAPIPALVVALNLAVDPLGLFRDGGPEREHAAILLRGENVVTDGRVNDRLVNKHYVDGRRERIGVALLGSSRSMAIHGSCFPGQSFFNFSVGGANVKDHVATYALLRERGLLPRTLVLGLDPWLLNRNGGTTWWVTLDAEYRRARTTFLREPGEPELPGLPVPERYLRLLSLQYFRFSLLVLEQDARRRPPAPARGRATRDLYGADFIRWWDGSYTWPAEARRLTAGEVRGLAMRYLTDGPPNYLDAYTRLDPDAGRELDALVDAVRRDGVELVLLLTPYHPDAFERLLRSAPYRIVADAEAHFRELARRRAVRLAGSYDPAVAGFDAGDFYDASHARDTALERWLRREPLR